MDRVRVSDQALAALRQRGWTYRQIAARVGLSYRRVGYRLHRVEREPAEAPAPQYSRTPVLNPPESCARCPRRLGSKNRLRSREAILPEDEFCQFCGRPRAQWPPEEEERP